MRAIENRAFSERRTPEELMDEAGYKIAQKVLHYFPKVKKVTAYLGKGHNAGDAIVALQHLKEAGWTVNIQTNILQRGLAPLTQKKLMALGVNYYQNQQKPESGSVLLDGLLGIGAKGPLRDKVAGLAEAINHHRNENNCSVVALDIPSGVDGDTGEIYEHAVEADLTITIGFPKTGLLTSRALNHVGALSLIKLDALKPEISGELSTLHLICEHSLSRKRRKFDTHKGTAGRVAIWAGSLGMLGAAALTATAALKAGAGLVTIFILPELFHTLAAMIPSEVMLRPSTSPLEMLDSGFNAIAMGPGMGNPEESISQELLEVAAKSDKPVILDADMLNLIASKGVLDQLTQHNILTPHPGEMARLMPESRNLTREETVSTFTQSSPATLLFKGARTIVSQKGSPLFINSSGTPAMATAGQGDVLTGIIVGLCAQGYEQLEATKLAAWLAGEAAQIAIAEEHDTDETLTASSVLAHLHKAFAQIDRRA